MVRKSPETKRPPFRLILIKPSKYDNDGYVIRYWRGVLPSNTLAALAGLTRQAEERGDLGEGVKVELTLLDELAQRIDPVRLAKTHKRGGAKVAVGLVGVQTNQFPRAADLARQFTDLGVPAMIGGFHVSGALAMSETTPPELQELMDYGVTLVKGEVEDAWGGILRDVYEGRRRLLYDIQERPDITHAPIPIVAGDYIKKFAYPNLGTIDAGRGCPFSCSFCTIINVQGKKMRCRSAEGIIAHVRTHFPEIRYYFFTDDNFARNPNWEAILDGLIQLREDEGLDVTFMMQVDAPSYRIRSFCEKARRAGCSQVFIGLEALREESLAAAGKKQNKAINYQAMVEAWHQSDIAIHVGYIIGFPDDTPALVAEDVRRLKEELGIDQVSFFILTPLPGSQDYADLIKAGAIVDPDYNKFDSFQPVTDHPKMTREEWLQAYLDAWDSFYTLDHMRDRLLASSEPIYWGLFKNYIWYRASVLERTHPMIAGFFRLKDRALRRPGFAVQGRWKHLRMRTRDVARTLRQWTRLYFDTQELWLETRPRRGRFAISMEELKARLAAVREGASLKGRRLQEAAGERVAAMREGATAQAHRLQEAASDRLTAMREGASVQAHRLQEAASERLTAMRTSAQEGLTRVQQNVQEGIKHGRQNLSAFGQEIVDTGRRTPGRIVRMWDKLRFWSAKGIYTRAALNQYWKTTYANLRKGRIFDINPAMLLWNALRDAKLTTSFAFHLILARTK